MCSCKQNTKGHAKQERRAAREFDRRQSTNAAMCHTCPHAIRARVPLHRHRWAAVGCKKGGEIPTRLTVGECPVWRHADSHGRTRWLGTLWWGVPCPIRVRLWLFHHTHRPPTHLPGCGCSVVLKKKAPRLTRWLGWCGR